MGIAHRRKVNHLSTELQSSSMKLQNLRGSRFGKK